MIDIFVVAGTYQQFLNLCSIAQQPWGRELKNKQVHYINHPDDLDGVPVGVRMFLYGTYQRRDDWETIRERLLQAGHRVLTMR